MMNMRYDSSDESIGDVFYAGSKEETSRIERNLKDFDGYGSFAGEAIVLRGLGLNSLR